MDILNQTWDSLDPAEFLKNYWQKKPLLVKGAFAPDFAQFSGDHLAGLSLEPDANSRLVREMPHWSVEHGPLEETLFETLPSSHWTLLVQEVDQWIEEVHDFRRSFDFIPRWRADDVMVSYATPQGGVGAHIDHYDVFLVQAHGTRRWRLGSEPILEENLVPDLPMKILRDFKPGVEVVVEPGDLLYLPPEWAHEGTALTEAMTWSVGFRSPSAEDFYRKLKEVAPELSLSPGTFAENIRFSDPNLFLRKDPYEILGADLSNARALFSTPIPDSLLARALGELVSEPFRGEEELDISEEEISPDEEAWELAASFRRFYYVEGDSVKLFAQGRTYVFSGEYRELIAQFCGADRWPVENEIWKNEAFLSDALRRRWIYSSR